MVQFPHIHLNGTDGGVLADEYAEAYRALTVAIEAMQKITVHGRDYYTIQRAPGGRDPTSLAYAEHLERLNRLRDVRNELAAIAMNIAEQNDERLARKGVTL